MYFKLFEPMDRRKIAGEGRNCNCAVLPYNKISKFAKQAEAAPAAGQQAVPLHFGQLIGQRAAFHIQIIGKLLAVERDREAAAPRPPRLLAKVGQQPRTNGARAGVQAAPGKRQIFMCQRPTASVTKSEAAV